MSGHVHLKGCVSSETHLSPVGTGAEASGLGMSISQWPHDLECQCTCYPAVPVAVSERSPLKAEAKMPVDAQEKGRWYYSLYLPSPSLAFLPVTLVRSVIRV